MTDHPVPDIVLERYRLNELPQDERRQLIDRLDRDQDLRERLVHLERSDEELREPVERLRVRLRAHEPVQRRFALAWAVPAVAAMGVIAFAIVSRTGAPVASDDRIKGGEASGRPSLALYRRTPEGSEQLADGDVVYAGDLVRVGYRAAGRRYGLIVSIDGAGTVTMHLPASGDRAVSLKNDPIVLLDDAYELDDAPRWEEFFFVASETAFDAAPVVEAARDAANTRAPLPRTDLALPSGLSQASFTLQKASRR
jgi:hypothetical protein